MSHRLTIASLAVIVWSTTFSATQERPVWVGALLRSTRAVKTSEALRVRESRRAHGRSDVRTAGGLGAGPGAGSRYVVSRQVPLTPSQVRGIEDLKKETRECMRMVVQGRYADAYQRLAAYSDAHPESRFETGYFLANLALISDRPDDAYRIAIEQCTRYHANTEAVWNQLSLACAEHGQVYDGQLAYIESQISTGLFNSGRGVVKDPYPVSSSPRGVAAASCLALGMSSGLWLAVPFLEMALRYDDRNYLAGESLVAAYDAGARYSSEARVSRELIRSLPAGKERDYFSSRLARCAHRQDDPTKYLRLFDARGRSPRPNMMTPPRP